MSLLNLFSGFDPLAPKAPRGRKAHTANATTPTSAQHSTQAEGQGARPARTTARERTPREQPVIARGVVIRQQRCHACGSSHSFVDGDFTIHHNERKDTRHWFAISTASQREAFARLPVEFYSPPEEEVYECYECLMLRIAAGALAESHNHDVLSQRQLHFSFDSTSASTSIFSTEPSSPAVSPLSALFAELTAGEAESDCTSF